jgi:hypothetical protein
MIGRRKKEIRMNIFQKGRRGLRRLPALVAIMIVAGIVLTPAIGGAAAFLTKAKADRRYLQNTSTVRSSAVTAPTTSATLTATCPPGLQAIGGGAESPAFLTSTSNQGMLILENKPIGAARPSAWYVEAFNIGSTPIEISAVAVCSK